MIREKKILKKMRKREPVFVVDIYNIIKDVYIKNISFTGHSYSISTKMDTYDCCDVFSSRYQAILSIIYEALRH